jgi:hypothetical protein
MQNTNPQLSPLSDNSGPTKTHALLAGSPAINAVLLADCSDVSGPIATDQRGIVRPQGGACDVGAFEFVPTLNPTLTVTKILIPSSDPGRCNLRINGVIKASNVGNGGTTGAIIRPLGPVTVDETAGTSTILSNYTTIIGGDCASNGAVTLAAGDNKTCTITNTRKPRLTVTKILIPSSDPGKFNLRVNGVIKASDVGNGGTTGAIIRPLGPVTVSETAGTSTSLTNYTTVIGGDCAANGTVTLAAGDNKTCTITNTRKPIMFHPRS